MALPCKLQQTPSYPVSTHAEFSFKLKKFNVYKITSKIKFQCA